VVQAAQGLDQGGGFGEHLDQLQIQSRFQGSRVEGKGVGCQVSGHSVDREVKVGVTTERGVQLVAIEGGYQSVCQQFQKGYSLVVPLSYDVFLPIIHDPRHMQYGVTGLDQSPIRSILLLPFGLWIHSPTTLLIKEE
jgi:hypothetical protein